MKRGRPRHTVTDEQWAKLLRLVGTSTLVARAVTQVGTSKRVLHRYIRHADAARREAWRFAVRWGRHRKNYSLLGILEALREVSTSNIGLKPALRKRGFTYAQAQHIQRWTQGDLEPQYMAATRVQQRLCLDDVKDGIWTDETAGTTRKSRQEIGRALFAVHKLKPMRIRRREAVAHRAAYAARNPLKALLLESRRRAKRGSKQ